MTYSWAVAYIVSVSIDFVYIKHMAIIIGLDTLVLYNLLRLLLLPLKVLIMG